ncbi:hypothetical protein WA158_003088 [Blastocystis sp. Blastoise]
MIIGKTVASVLLSLLSFIVLMMMAFKRFSEYQSYPFYHHSSDVYNPLINVTILANSTRQFVQEPLFSSEIFMNFDEFLDYYISWQNEMVSHGIPDKFVCFEPTNVGIATTIYGLISTMFYAMITKRPIMICNFPTFPLYFRTAMNIPLYNLTETHTISTLTYKPCYPGFPWLLTTEIYPFTYNRQEIMNCQCKLIHYYIRNSKFKHRLYEMGVRSTSRNAYITESRIISLFMKRLFFPSLPIKETIDSFTEEWASYYILGVHIRAGDRISFQFKQYSPIPYEYRRQQLVNATLERTRALNKTNIKWFIATDYSPLKVSIQQNYPQYAFYYNSTIVHTGINKYQIPSQGTFDAILELYLLSTCQERIVSSITSYGELATLINPTGNKIIKMTNVYTGDYYTTEKK